MSEVAVHPRRCARRRSRRSITIGVAIVVVLVLWGSAAASFWSHDAKVNTVTLAAGTLGATLSDVPTELTVLASSNSRNSSFSVTNSGSVLAPFTVAFTLGTGVTPFTHTLSTWKHTGACNGKPGKDVKTGTWGNLSYSGSLAAGASAHMCLRLATHGAPGTRAATFTGTIALDSTLSSWSASDSGSTAVAQEARVQTTDIAAVSIAGVGVRVDSGALDAEIASYALYRSTSAAAEGEVVSAGGRGSVFIIDDTFSADWVKPPADTSYWYRVKGLRSDGAEAYATDPSALIYPFGGQSPVLIRQADDAGKGLCWQAYELAVDSFFHLQPCNSAEPLQQFVIVRAPENVDGGGRLFIYSAADRSLAVVRNLDTTAKNDDVVFGAHSTSLSALWQPQPVKRGAVATPQEKVMTIFRNNAYDSGDPAFTCIHSAGSVAGASLYVSSLDCHASDQVRAAWHVDPIE